MTANRQAQAWGSISPKYRLQVFVLTAVLASLSGSLFCFYLRFAAPGIFGFDLLVEIILMTVIGGLGTIWAPALGKFYHHLAP